jgi:hypothetical protein
VQVYVHRALTQCRLRTITTHHRIVGIDTLKSTRCASMPRVAVRTASRLKLVRCAPSSRSQCDSVGLATEGTVANGARHDIDITPAQARCRNCDAQFVLDDVILLCRFGSADVDVLSGREMRIMSMEVS